MEDISVIPDDHCDAIVIRQVLPAHSINFKGFDHQILLQAINYLMTKDLLLQAFTNMRKVMNKGAKLIFNTPNFMESKRHLYTSFKDHSYVIENKHVCAQSLKSMAIANNEFRLKYKKGICLRTDFWAMPKIAPSQP